MPVQVWRSTSPLYYDGVVIFGSTGGYDIRFVEILGRVNSSRLSFCQRNSAQAQLYNYVYMLFVSSWKTRIELQKNGNRGKFPGGGGSQEFESMIQAGDVTWLE